MLASPKCRIDPWAQQASAPTLGIANNGHPGQNSTKIYNIELEMKLQMPRARIFLLISLAMTAFAGNSLLCRLALKNTGIDPASFTTIRLVSGAIILCLIIGLQRKKTSSAGSWLSAFALFSYAAGFSFAYLQLSAAAGALLLFGAVQATMLGYGFWVGERLRAWQIAGLVLALAGLLLLLLPGVSAPPLSSSLLMIGAGIAWGIYSLRGRGTHDATLATSGNFLRATGFAIVLSVLMLSRQSLDNTGIIYAICSGTLTSGIGYAIWYAALPALKATTAATVQLSVPVITALGGIALLNEAISLRIGFASAAILGGIAIVIAQKNNKAST